LGSGTFKVTRKGFVISVPKQKTYHGYPILSANILSYNRIIVEGEGVNEWR
jgi:hypothetical protein